MANLGELSAGVAQQRRAFLDAMAEIRPRLHRYCSKMTGSVLDGEDVVQETLGHAFYRLHTLADPTRLSSWLFRIAHNKAIDHIRKSEGKTVSLDETHDIAAPLEADRVQVEEALTKVVTHLPPKERACVVLKDVLDYPLEDIAGIVGSTVGGVKSALHRGRGKLAGAPSPERDDPDPTQTRLIAAYVNNFNRQDWDGVKALLAADARLEVVDRSVVEGREAISTGYFFNYARLAWRWRLRLSRVDGVIMLVHWRDDGEGWRPHAPILLQPTGGEVVAIKDFVHVEYLLEHAHVEPLNEGQ
jgi:RNA polymerase sigma-70 factor (ECF subfamily)